MRGDRDRAALRGISGPWILKQLPLEVEDSEVGTIRSSSSLSRICVQCTSAWISKGSAGFMICCSLWLPTSVPGSEVEEMRKGETMEEGSRKQTVKGRMGSNTTGKETERKVTVIAGSVGIRKRQKLRIHTLLCAHSHDFYLFNLILLFQASRTLFISMK